MIAALSAPFAALLFGLVTYLDRLQRQLARLASTDVLTALPNRRAFMDRTQQALDGGASGVLIILDADHFKRINDTYGHAVGDACLVAIADHLRRCLTPPDLIGRIGGEEFAAFLPDRTIQDSFPSDAALTGPIHVRCDADGATLEVTLSAGAAPASKDGALETILHFADRAFYQAKSNGRARIEIWAEPLPSDLRQSA